MSKGNHRLPAWLAGITALVATAGVAGAQEPNATGDTESAAIAGLKDCTSSNGGTSGRCDETQSGQTARDEDARTQMAQRDERDEAPAPRDETTQGFDEEGSRSVAQDDTSNDASQTGSEHLAGHSADETQQTRVVPPAHATPSHPSMSGATASNDTTGQDNGESSSAGANADDANSATWQNEDRSPQNVARAQQSASSSDYDNDSNGNADEQDASDRADAMASEQDTQSTRSVPPEHATRMPENDRAWSSSETAANERAGETGSSAEDESRNDANAPSRTDTYASQHEERDDSSSDRGEAIGAGTSSGIASSSAVQSQFDALDTDHDGTIDAAEAAVSTTLRAQFFTLDSDSDGKISLSEFKGASDIASIRADRGKRRE